MFTAYDTCCVVWIAWNNELSESTERTVNVNNYIVEINDYNSIWYNTIWYTCTIICFLSNWMFIMPLIILQYYFIVITHKISTYDIYLDKVLKNAFLRFLNFIFKNMLIFQFFFHFVLYSFFIAHIFCFQFVTICHHILHFNQSQ